MSKCLPMHESARSLFKLYHCDIVEIVYHNYCLLKMSACRHQCVCVCAVGSSSEWMNSVISMLLSTVYHPGFHDYVCLEC